MLISWLFTAAGWFVHFLVHVLLCTEKRQKVVRDSVLNYEVLQQNVFPVLDAVQNLFSLAPESFFIPVVDT